MDFLIKWKIIRLPEYIPRNTRRAMEEFVIFTSWPKGSRRLSKSLRQADEPYEDGQMVDRDQGQENELAMASIGEITSNMRMKKRPMLFLGI